MTVAVLADDTTGALEIGALLAPFGAVVQLDRVPCGGDVVVFDTQTRHLPEAEAYSVIRGLAGQLSGAIYKKTDSTLRGRIGAEFDALLDAFPTRRIVYAPAYPKLGRTVVNSVLLVNGVPVSETSFAHDPHDPVRESSVGGMLRSTCRGHARVTVHDAQTDDDLARIAASLDMETDIAAGPGGFAAHWAARLLYARQPRPLPRITRPLLVCGSLHPMSRAQADVARRRGLAILETPAERLTPAPDPGPEVAARIQRGEAESLIIFGGDTVRSILTALGETRLAPLGEVLPGIAISITSNGLPLITKAGGFGKEDLIREILERLT